MEKIEVTRKGMNGCSEGKKEEQMRKKTDLEREEKEIDVEDKIN